MCRRRFAIHPRFPSVATVLFLLAGMQALAQPGSQAMERAIGYIQAPKANARWYVHWGYHRAEYGRADLRLVGPGIDLTLHDLKATDMPSSWPSPFPSSMPGSGTESMVETSFPAPPGSAWDGTTSNTRFPMASMKQAG